MTKPNDRIMNKIKKMFKASEVLRAFGRVGIPTSQAVDAFRSASLHVQMVGRALRYRPYTWRMTRGKQPRRVKIYARPPHVIDYAKPPVVRDAAMQAIVDNWEVPRG